MVVSGDSDGDGSVGDDGNKTNNHIRKPGYHSPFHTQTGKYDDDNKTKNHIQIRKKTEK